MTLDRTALGSALTRWLPEQRWFGAKGRDIRAVDIVDDTLMREGEHSFHHVIARVNYADGEPDMYQVPIGVAAALPEHLLHTEIGRAGDGTAYDALHDADFSRLLLELIAHDRTIGSLTFQRGLPTEDDEPIDTSLHGRVLGAEQSNSSLLYAESYVLKMFRRLLPGTNPDLEITRALAERGSTAVPRPLGSVEGTVGGEPTTLALLQPYIRLAVDGWALAETSVRDLFAEADLHADEVGGDFAGEALRLGATTAHVHVALAEAFPTMTAGRAQVGTLATAMTKRLEDACATVPELRPFEEPLRAAYAELAQVEDKITMQRIHGDYHLGQVLRTEHGWILLDFEGEPTKSLVERRAPDSPLRDVAAMLRSFDYAARHLLTASPSEPQLAYRASEWAERNREAFCDGYAEASGSDPRKAAVVLRAYELDKAVYEVVYEAGHRPSWLSIPLGAVERLVT
ncbi:MAG: maltokinase [Frankiales bacterium]|nr:maltokinase [Frankiales bacterium]